MTVAVVFPDGTVRRVIGALKLEREGFVQNPINCDPHWKYEWRSDRWVATARHGQIRAMPRGERLTWWEDIPQMADDEAFSQEDTGSRRSAA